MNKHQIKQQPKCSYQSKFVVNGKADTFVSSADIDTDIALLRLEEASYTEQFINHEFGDIH